MCRTLNYLLIVNVIALTVSIPSVESLQEKINNAESNILTKDGRDLKWLMFATESCPKDNPVDSPTPVSCYGDAVCNFGVDQCCGDKFPTATCECFAGVFKCTKHSLCKDRACPSSSSCPEEEPAHKSQCNTPSTESCSYRRTSCCGKTYNRRLFSCFDGKWNCEIDLLMSFDCMCEDPEDLDKFDETATDQPISIIPTQTPTTKKPSLNMPVFSPAMSPASSGMIPEDAFKPVPQQYLTNQPSREGITDLPTPCPTEDRTKRPVLALTNRTISDNQTNTSILGNSTRKPLASNIAAPVFSPAMGPSVYGLVPDNAFKPVPQWYGLESPKATSNTSTNASTTNTSTNTTATIHTATVLDLSLYDSNYASANEVDEGEEVESVTKSVTLENTPTSRPFYKLLAPVWSPAMSPSASNIIPPDFFKPVPETFETSPPEKTGPTDAPTPCPSATSPSAPIMEITNFSDFIIPLDQYFNGLFNPSPSPNTNPDAGGVRGRDKIMTVGEHRQYVRMKKVQRKHSKQLQRNQGNEKPGKRSFSGNTDNIEIAETPEKERQNGPL